MIVKNAFGRVSKREMQRTGKIFQSFKQKQNEKDDAGFLSSKNRPPAEPSQTIRVCAGNALGRATRTIKTKGRSYG